MHRDLELRRATQRRYRLMRHVKGLCDKCDLPRRPDKTTCAGCGRADSARRLGYTRRVLGVVPRYPNGQGYRPRTVQPVARLTACPAACPRCAGFVVDMTIEWKCVNCGWVQWGILPMRERAAR